MRHVVLTILWLTSLACAAPVVAADKAPHAQVEEMLRGFTDKYSKSDRDFYYLSPIIKGDGGGDVIYVYWMTGNSIIIVTLPTGASDDYSWYWTKARVELATDVVPTQMDINGSTYLCDSGWVEARLKDCLNNGKKLIIERTKAKVSAPH